VLQSQDLRVGQVKELCIRLTQENSIENSVQDCLPYIQIPNGLYKLFLAYSKWPCVLHIVWHHPSRTFYILLCVMWLVTMSSDVTCYVTAWSCHSNPNPSSENRIKKINWKENRNKKSLSPLLSFLTTGLIVQSFHTLYIVASTNCYNLRLIE